MSEMLEKWAKKLNIPIAELADKLRRFKADVRYLHPDLPEEKVEQKAIIRLGAELSSMLRSARDAVVFRGICIGIEERRDMWGRIIRVANEMWNQNPTKAVTEGYTDADGHPLDWRKETSPGVPNPRYGERITSVWTRTVYFVGSINQEEEDLYRIECRGDWVDFPWELGKSYTLLARAVGEFRGLKTLRTIRVSNPREIEGPVLSTVFFEAPETMKAKIMELDDFLGDAPSKIAVIIGDVIRAIPVERGGLVVMIGDVLEDIDFEGIPFYCPAILGEPKEGHRIVLFARIRYRADVGRWANTILGWCEE